MTSLGGGIRSFRVFFYYCFVFVTGLVGLLLVSFESSNAQPSVDGEWHGPYYEEVRVQAIHAALTHTSLDGSPCVVMWSYAGAGNSRAKAWKLNGWQPDSNPVVITLSGPPPHLEWQVNEAQACEGNTNPPTETMLFCAGHTFLADGNLLTAGGGAALLEGPPPDCTGTTQIHGASYRLLVSGIADGQSPWDPSGEPGVLGQRAMGYEDPPGSAVFKYHGYYYPSVRLDTGGTVLAIGGGDCTNCQPHVAEHLFQPQGLNQPWFRIGQLDNVQLHATYPFVNILTWPSYATGDVSVIDRYGFLHKRLTTCGGDYRNCAWADFPAWGGSPDLSTSCATPLMYTAPGVPTLPYPNGSVIFFGAGSTSIMNRTGIAGGSIP